MNIDVSATNFIPLSAYYGLNDNIVLNSTLIELDNGFNFIKQNIFANNQDVVFGNKDLLTVTQLNNFYVFTNSQKYVDSGEFVIFTGLKNKKNNSYITNINNVLYATSPTCSTQSEFFRILREDDIYYITQNGFYATIVINNGKWDIIMSEKLDSDPYNTQKFYVSSNQTLDTLTIKSKFIVPQWDSSPTIERYWSYSYVNSAVRSNGLIADDDYIPENNYYWETTVSVGLFAIGFNNDIKWVKYYNQIDDRKYNQTVDIKEVISNIPLNYLISCPYEKAIEINSNKTGKMNVNISNLKNIATPEYNNSNI